MLKLITDPHKYDWGAKHWEVIENYNTLVEKLWEPFNYKNDNFPDDNYKVDVCWWLENELGEKISIWNYKTGHYAENNDLESLDYFSLWYSNQNVLNEFKNQFDFNIKEL